VADAFGQVWGNADGLHLRATLAYGRGSSGRDLMAAGPTGKTKAKRAKQARVEPQLIDVAQVGSNAGPNTMAHTSPAFARFKIWLLLRKQVLVRRLIKTVAALIAAPLILTLLYALPFVRPVSTLMLWDLVTFNGYSRDWKSIDDISPNLKHSVIMSEDGQFCRHHGVDLGELRGVVEDALEGESPRGASTITMQLAKNLFLWNGRSLLRKGLELPLAAYIDLVLSKRRIMEIYLNIAEWGPDGVYGIGAGAAYHFGIDAASMSRRQAALLTVTLPNPVLRKPAKPSRGLSNIARIVERRARAAGDYVACLDA
jgi:monofunctional glycosyltransferase